MAMSGDDRDRGEVPANREQRQHRLATALRDNLKRRKAQVRHRTEKHPPEREGEGQDDTPSE